MSSMDVLDVGQANEFKLACRRNNFTPEDLKWLCGGDMLAQVRRVRLGQDKITPNYINCDANPFVPPGWSIKHHQKNGSFELGPFKIKLKDTSDVLLKDTLIWKELVLNANALDYLLKNQNRISRSWKGKWIFFLGTVYKMSHDYPDSSVVRYLYWNYDRWSWGHLSIEVLLKSNRYHAAVLEY